MKIKLITAFIAAAALISSNVNAETQVSTKGGLKVTSGDYEFKFGGRIMYDYNKAEKNSITDEDGFNLRRGRVYASGKIGGDWSFKTQFNTNGDGVEDLYLRYGGWGEAANVTIGNQNMPFGLELLTSSKDISVLERSAITERYAVGRKEGVQLHGKLGGNQTYGVAVFTDDVNADEAGEETGFAARYTIAPIKTDNSVVHFGLAYKDIEDASALGFEAAASSGPFHIQAEYVDAEEGINDDLSGYYVQAGYILTGETRPYSGGKFKRVSPNGRGGAWELVARYEDGDGNHSDIELSNTDATAYTIGLNWYAHKNVRLGINYTDGEDNNDEDEGNELRVRFQLTF
ncbi:MAG: phosphate-selective porin OprO/OprP [Cryomorphaceae bacterium]|jgi:phosphate-selective porin OprO/OprP